MATPLDAVESHRAASDHAHFEHAYSKQMLSLRVLLRPKRGHHSTVVGAPRAHKKVQLRKRHGLPWLLQGDCIAFSKMSPRLQHSASAV